MRPAKKPPPSRNESQAKRPSRPLVRASSIGPTASLDVPEQEDEDARRGRGKERLRARLDALHPADRQAEEDRKPGNRAEPENLGGAHVRLTLQKVGSD